MIKRRKHRVVVDITFEKPVSQKVAVCNVGMLLNDGCYISEPITKFETKQFNRVFVAELLKWRRKTQLRDQRVPPFHRREYRGFR